MYGVNTMFASSVCSGLVRSALCTCRDVGIRLIRVNKYL